MAEHYTTNTESVTRWCNACNRPTQHKVSGGRVGRCMEHDAPLESQRQRAARLKRERELRAPMFDFEGPPAREPGEGG